MSAPTVWDPSVTAVAVDPNPETVTVSALFTKMSVTLVTPVGKTISQGPKVKSPLLLIML